MDPVDHFPLVFLVDSPILIPATPLHREDLEKFRNAPFETMIKFAVDIRSDRIALGGDMHADAEAELLRTGSAQEDIWGGNLWPWKEAPQIEFISLINIRPSADNMGMGITRDDIRNTALAVVRRWVELP